MEYPSVNRALNVFGYKGKATLSYEGGKLRDVCFYVSRKGSVVYGYFQTVGKIISASLRRNVSYKVIIEKLEEVYIFEPSGMSDISDEPLESFAQYIAEFLKKYYKEPEVINGKKREIQGKHKSKK